MRQVNFTPPGGRSAAFAIALALIAACGAQPAEPTEVRRQAVLTDPSLLRPILECVDQIDATHYVAHFGYLNTVTDSVSVPIGANNKFTPTPQDRGQPTLFEPGRKVNVFTVAFNGSNQVWKLGPRTSTASSGSTRCVYPDAGSDTAPPNLCVTPVAGLDDGNPCTTDTCDPATGVHHTPVAAGTACADGNVCNGAETCNATGVCTAGTALVVDDENVCTVDACDAVAGVSHVPVAAGTACGDGNPCNGADTCNVSGACAAGTPLVVDDGNPCTVDSCDSVSGAIAHQPDSSLPGCSALPDLTVSSIDPSGTSVDPGSMAISGTAIVVVKNLGGGTTRNPTTVVLFEDRNDNKVADTATDSILGTAPVGILGPGATATITVTVTGEVSFPGNLATAFVDPGLVVEEANEVNNALDTTPPCIYQTPPPRPFAAKLKWSWNGSGINPQSYSSSSPLLVADITDDGIPEVIFSSRAFGIPAAGFLRAVNGKTGIDVFPAPPPISAIAGIAIGDLDNDGSPEIVVTGGSGLTVSAYDRRGALKWTSRGLLPIDVGYDQSAQPAIADLDGDGRAEIVLGENVVDADGNVRWQGAFGKGYGAPINVRMSVVADLDLDGRPEVIAGNTAYRYDGDPYWINRDVPDGWVGVANLDDDPFPEVVLVSEGTVHLLEHDGTHKWSTVFNQDHYGEAAPSVADLDGDGVPEIGVASYNTYTALRADGNIMWQNITRDISSGATGSAMFDFDGDGISEVVYQDEIALYVFRGRDGATLWKTEAWSGTLVEYPVVADVDGDGKADIVKINNSPLSPQNGIQVWESAYDDWAVTRPLWNQNAYHIGNVNDDLTIPVHEPASWLTHNTYRAQRFPDVCATAKIDAVASRVQIQGTSATVRIGNSGALRIPSGLAVSFYQGDPLSDGIRLGTVRTGAPINAGHYVDLSFALPANWAGDNLFIVADDIGGLRGEHSESDEFNNFARTPASNLAPRVALGPDRIVQMGGPVLLDGTVTDDGFPSPARLTLAWSLLSGPASVSFTDPAGPLTGATFTTPGTYVIRLSANDGALSSSDLLSLTVVDPSANVGPEVHAGPDQLVEITQPSLVAGSVDDDGIPFGTLSAEWTLVEGPAPVMFGDSHAYATSVTFAEVGFYTLRLTATDGQLTTYDEVVFDVVHVLGTDGNHPPSGGAQDLAGLVGDSLPTFAPFSDDGLPVGGSLTFQWSVISGPGAVHFDDPTSAFTNVVFDAPGKYVLAILVSDGELTTAFTCYGYITTPANLAPVITVTSPINLAFPQTSAALSALVTDDGKPTGSALTTTWQMINGPGPVSFSHPGSTTTQAFFDVPGAYTLTISVNDTQFTSSAQVLVFVEGAAEPGPAPTLAIDNINDLQKVTAPINVNGTITGASLFAWRLELREKVDSAEWKTIGRGDQPVVGGLLGRLDPTLLVNGMYELRLKVTDGTGGVQETSRRITVEDNMKVGHFTLTFADVDVPLAGLPMQLFRSYDSRNLAKGDFGYGWNMEISRIRISESSRIGSAFTVESDHAPFFPTLCIVPSRPLVVSVTLSDGKVHKFAPRVEDGCQVLTAPDFATVVFDALDGTSSELEVTGGGGVFVGRDDVGEIELQDLQSAQPFDPSTYTLTLADGRKITGDQLEGFQSYENTNGDSLVYIPFFGFTQSSGRSFAIGRDPLNGISNILDVATGKEWRYSYDLNGDLRSYRDPAGNETKFNYHPQLKHYLTEIIDARGVRALRNEYDDDGRLISTTDSLGKVMSYTHDLDDNREIVVDRNLNQRVLEYDTRGNVTREVDQEGGVTLRTFDLHNNRLSEMDPSGRSRSWTYDGKDNVLTETDPAGQVTTHTCGPLARLLTTTDPLGATWTNTYDYRGNLLTQDGPLAGDTTTNTYNAQGRLVTTVDAQGHTTTCEYDDAGNRVKTKDALNNETLFTYNLEGRVLTESRTRTTPGGVETLVTTHAYDVLGREVETHDALGAVTRTGYDKVGNRVWQMDDFGRTTRFEFDSNGRMTAQRFPGDTTETSTFDPEGRRISSVDRAGRTTTYSYDKTGRLLQTTFPDGSHSSRTYDAAGRVLTSTDPATGTTTFTYDAAGRQATQTDALGGQRVFTYDLAGRQTKVRDARGFETQYVYDAAGRQTTVIFPDGTTKVTGYDLLDRSTSETDQSGRTTLFGYDALGRLTTVTDALGQVTSYGYDEVGSRVSRTDAALATTTYGYDAVGRETRRTLPDGKSETKEYDAVGNMVARVDFAGRRTGFSYDRADRLQAKQYPDTTSVQFTYTETGRRKTAVDARGTTIYAYDNRDRVVSKTDPAGWRVESGWDSGGRPTRTSVFAGGVEKTTLHSYDLAGRPATTTDPEGRVFTHEHDAGGLPTKLVRPNGVDTSWTHDNLRRLTNVRTFRRANNATVASYAYTLGATGVRTRIDEADGTARDYGYDGLYRLVSETVSGGGGPQYGKTFGYDAVSNRTSQVTTGLGLPAGSVSYTYDSRQRLLTENGVAYSWDDNGNLVTKSDGDTYTWDFDDRLVRVTKADGTVVDNTYDVDGVLVRTRVTPAGGGSAVVTDLVVDTGGGLSHVVGEVAGGTLGVVYVRAGDMLLEEIREGVARYQEAEGIGSVRSLIDASGVATDSWRYTAFGEEAARTGTTASPYQFAGERNVSSVGMYQNRARWLSTGVGRFVSDDHGPPTGYSYAHGDAVNYSDPSGYLDSIGGLMTGLVGISILATLPGCAIQGPGVGGGPRNLDNFFDSFADLDEAGEYTARRAYRATAGSGTEWGAVIIAHDKKYWAAKKLTIGGLHSTDVSTMIADMKVGLDLAGVRVQSDGPTFVGMAHGHPNQAGLSPDDISVANDYMRSGFVQIPGSTDVLPTQFQRSYVWGPNVTRTLGEPAGLGRLFCYPPTANCGVN